MFIGVVGSGKYKNKDFIIKELEYIINPEIDIIVSGHSPRNPIIKDGILIRYDNVDIWAEDWAIEFCWNLPIIYETKEFNKKEFFKRNKSITYISNKLLVFINKGQFKSGAWNTVSHFIRKPNFNFSDLMIYNQFGKLWRTDKLPLWLNKKIQT